MYGARSTWNHVVNSRYQRALSGHNIAVRNHRNFKHARRFSKGVAVVKGATGVGVGYAGYKAATG